MTRTCGSPKTLICFQLLLLFMFRVWCSSSVSFESLLLSEKSVLLQFKDSVSDPHGILSGWDTDESDHCSWRGVSCDSDSRVSSLNITGDCRGRGNHNNLVSPRSWSTRFPFYYGYGIRTGTCENNGKLMGKLPPVIGKLTQLRVLSLPFNDFSGEIPLEIWNMSGLEIIDFEGNSFSGKLPHDFTRFKILQVLNLGFNRLVREIPLSLSECAELQVLNLAGNQLSGTVPDTFGNTCQNLKHVDLSGNLLNGEIPRTFGNCSELKTLLLFSNMLRGYIPHEFGHLRKLEVLDVSRNILGGPIPRKLGGCISLSVLVLSDPVDALSLRRPFDRVLIGSHMEKNRFQGSIPTAITSLPMLRILWAPMAALEGEFPSSWGGCRQLETINLAQNHFTSEISGLLRRCKNLHYLNFSSNKLTGKLDENFPLPCMVVFDVSGNLMTGSIPRFNYRACQSESTMKPQFVRSYSPTSPYLLKLNSLKVLELPSNLLSSGTPQEIANMRRRDALLDHSNNKKFSRLRRFLLSSDPQGVNSRSQNNSPSLSGNDSHSGECGLTSIEIASIISGSVIAVVLLALAVLYFYMRKWMPKSRVQVTEMKEIAVFTDPGVPLTFDNIVQATGNFSYANCIGNGGFGATYKAEISPGILVAVKRLSVGRFVQGVPQFHAEIKTLGGIRHPNLVTLIGYHASQTEMFLIYNFFPGGNLENFIQKRSATTVNWEIIHKIALDIASALTYLHDECVPRVLHRDVKPSNILLDDDFNAYLSDFGLSRLLGATETHATTGVAGTFGYVAPEYAMTCRVSDKSDVYSYGVVLLELISNKKALDPSFSAHRNGFNIVSWACMQLRQGLAKDVFTEGLWDTGPHDKLVEMLHLAVMCTVESLSIRPTMKLVVQRLNQIQIPSGS